jgi:hypothetical protein
VLRKSSYNAEVRQNTKAIELLLLLDGSAEGERQSVRAFGIATLERFRAS